MPNKVYINGKFFEAKDAKISVFDRSYLYGEGVFETMRAYNGRPAFCDMHYHRLKTNCEKLKIELPVDEYAFDHAIVKLLNTNKLKDAYIRVTVSPVGASMGLARPPQTETNLVMWTRKFEGRPEEVYKKGAKVCVIKSVFGDEPELSQIKSTNYLTKMLARAEVIEQKCDEGLLLNREGLVLEGTASNLFVIKKGRIFTPPLSDGCLPGITRWVLIGLCEQLNITCKEASLYLEDIKDADEIFLTGSTSEILPVREITNVFKKTAPGNVTKKLIATYKELIRS